MRRIFLDDGADFEAEVKSTGEGMAFQNDHDFPATAGPRFMDSVAAQAGKYPAAGTTPASSEIS